LGAKVVSWEPSTGNNTGVEEDSWQDAARENNVLASPISMGWRRTFSLFKAFASQGSFFNGQIRMQMVEKRTPMLTNYYGKRRSS
jgi:hypothetical protein